MKKIILIALLLLPFYWFMSEAKTAYNFEKPIIKFQADSTVLPPKLNFDYIKSRTSKLGKKVEVDAHFCEENNRMTKAFITNYLSAQEIVVGDPITFDCKNSDGFCFKEYKEFETFNLFTFTYQNGYCCKTLYAVTTKKDTLAIINIGVLAFSANKSGWLGDKYGKWISEDVMDMTTVSHYDDDFIEDNNNSRIDTTWSIIRINKEGLLKENIYKKVAYLEGRKIE
ncbi:hypothetical protein [Flavobacterium ovatum]|uniref:hypothetical protein n=1 Tax=Flavobacterium ovatum TaxID=1928857 RepID=UPI00344D2064